MLRLSSLGTGCCVLLVVLTLFGTTFGDPTNTTTKLLTSFAQSKVLSMGVLDKNLLIITKDTPPMVFEIPMENYVYNYDSQINLYGVVPVELKDKWPMLTSNDNFTKRVLGGGVAQSFSIGLDKATLISVFHSDNEKNHTLLKTVTFKFKSPSATYREFKISKGFHFDEAHFISSDKPNVSFNLKITDEGQTYRLYKFSFNNSDGFKSEWKADMCKSSNGDGFIMFSPAYSKCSSIDWKIENGGFVYRNRFHLFTKDQVYMFEYKGQLPDNTSEVALKVVKLTDYFIYVIWPIIPPDNTTISTPLDKVTISIITIGVALVVFMALFVTAVLIRRHFNNSADVDVQNRDDKNSDSDEMDHILQSHADPKESSNDDSADTAGSSNVPTDAGTSGNVSPKSVKSVHSTIISEA